MGLFLSGFGAGAATGLNNRLAEERARREAELQRRFEFYVKNVAPEYARRKGTAEKVRETNEILVSRSVDPGLASIAARRFNGDLDKALDFITSPEAQRFIGIEPLELPSFDEFGNRVTPRSSLEDQLAFLEGKPSSIVSPNRNSPKQPPFVNNSNQGAGSLQGAQEGVQPAPQQPKKQEFKPIDISPSLEIDDKVFGVLADATKDITDPKIKAQAIGMLQKLKSSGASFDDFMEFQKLVGKQPVLDLEGFNKISLIGQRLGIEQKDKQSFMELMADGKTEEALKLVPQGTSEIKFDNAFVDDIVRSVAQDFGGQLTVDPGTGNLIVAISDRKLQPKANFIMAEAAELGRILVGEKGQQITPVELKEIAKTEVNMLEQALLSPTTANETEKAFISKINGSDSVSELAYIESIIGTEGASPVNGIEELEEEQLSNIRSTIQSKKESLLKKEKGVNRNTPDKGDTKTSIDFSSLSGEAQAVILNMQRNQNNEEEARKIFNSAPPEVQKEITEFFSNN